MFGRPAVHAVLFVILCVCIAANVVAAPFPMIWIEPTFECTADAPDEPLSSPITSYKAAWVRDPATPPNWAGTPNADCSCEAGQAGWIPDEQISIPAPATTATIELLPGTYYFAMTASNAAGESCYSNVVMKIVEPDPSTPNAPINFEISALFKVLKSTI